MIALPGSPVENATSFEDLRNASWGAVIGTTDSGLIWRTFSMCRMPPSMMTRFGVFQAIAGGTDRRDACGACRRRCLPPPCRFQRAGIRRHAARPMKGDRGHGFLFEFGNPLVEWVDEALTRSSSAAWSRI